MKRALVFAGGLTSSFICFNAIDNALGWSGNADDGVMKFSRRKIFRARTQNVYAASKGESLVCFCLLLISGLYCKEFILYTVALIYKTPWKSNKMAACKKAS